MTDPTADTLPCEPEPAASDPLTTRHLLLGVAFFAAIWLFNGLVAIVVISLLQGAGLLEAAADGGSAAGDVLGDSLARFGLAFGEAAA
jgi:hypothetical protein